VLIVTTISTIGLGLFPNYILQFISQPTLLGGLH
jgi:hypothetical protein